MRQLHLNWFGVQEWERMVARVLSLGWGVFWAWFGFASGVAEYASFGDVLLETLPGLIFIGISLYAWRHPAAGGAVLLALAIVVFCAYWSSAGAATAVQAPGTAILLSLPPFMSGALFLAAAPSAAQRDC